jgi:MFS family permease
MASPADPAEIEEAPLLRPSSPSPSTLGPASSQSSVRGLRIDPTRRRQAQIQRALSFISSIISSICAGSIAVFSLYGHLLQSKLHFSQFEVNAIVSAMNICLYIPVPIIGYVCDRVGPTPLTAVSILLLGGGYGLAAAIYHKGELASSAGARSNHALVPFMVLAFGFIGIGTGAMYVSAMTTCAKNFGKGKYRGLMLVAPMVAFGLSGIIVSQLASRVLYDELPDGSRGDINVFHFFVVLAVLFVIVGTFGIFALKVVDEDELIDEAVDELERSGFLSGSEIFRRRANRTYGTIDGSVDPNGAGTVDPAMEDDSEEDRKAKLKKAWLLNAETRRFLGDHTMWSFALGFFLIIGSGESFINNLGTIIGTLGSPFATEQTTSAATHVSVVAGAGTAARLITGILSDLVSPSPQTHTVQTGVANGPTQMQRWFSVSRVPMFIFVSLLISVGTAVLASGFVQDHQERFWIVSSCVGAGYGAVFSLMPIIVTMIWGVENFGTNFGVFAALPALSSTMWNLIYSAEYQAGARNSPSLTDGSDDDVFCYGRQCYTGTFWAMTACIWVGCLFIAWAWKGRDGWSRRGIVV